MLKMILTTMGGNIATVLLLCAILLVSSSLHLMEGLTSSMMGRLVEVWESGYLINATLT
jgi:hypothetical protein